MSRWRRPGLVAAALGLAVGLAGCTSGTAPDRATSGSTTASDPVSVGPSASPTAEATGSPTTSATATRSSGDAPARRNGTRLAVVPRRPYEPAVRFPSAPPAAGTGANATVSLVPRSLWSAMRGYSWTPGCPVGRGQLRLVRVNYWGFDGVRHRGRLVVNVGIASAAARAFASLYAQQFRIRVMRPMDSTWGHNPKGPGADDYAAMRADNTSAFNCRYVGGEEASKRWSNHAYGRAIDVNDLENPYVATGGRVFPGTYFLHRRQGAGIFTSSSSAAVRAFTRQGFRWGGLWRLPDLQHMERT